MYKWESKEVGPPMDSQSREHAQQGMRQVAETYLGASLPRFMVRKWHGPEAGFAKALKHMSSIEAQRFALSVIAQK